MLRPLLLLALASVGHAETITEVVAVGDGFLARRDDGLVMVAVRSTPKGHSIPPFEIPRDASPLVSDANSAWCLARGGDGEPALIELRVDAPKVKAVHPLPPGSAAAPVGVDATSVHLDDGTRFDRAARALVEEDGSGSGRVVAALGPCRLRLGADGTYTLENATTSVRLPDAQSAELTDVALGQVIVVLDHERAQCRDVATLEPVRELTLDGAPILSAHARDDGWWLHAGATTTCPAALVSLVDGVVERVLALPEGARVIGGGYREIALLLPGADADRLLLAHRTPHEQPERLWLAPLRDRAARVGHGIAVGAGRAGFVIGFIPIAIILMAAEDADEPPEDDAARARREARLRQKLETKLASLGAQWPSPGDCGAEIDPLTAGSR